MLEYRFVIMDPDGSVKDSLIQNLPDDISALDRAQALIAIGTIEAWQASRMVFRLRPDGSSAVT